MQLIDDKFLLEQMLEISPELVKFKDNSIIYYYSFACGNCIMLKPVIKELEKLYENSFKFYQIDFDDNKLSSKLFGIQNTPIVLISYNNNISKIEGAFPLQSYQEYIEGLISQEN